jgi:hypothetical protein
MTRKTQSGQALVLAAVALVALVGVMGLAVDMGVLRYDKRLQQTAADAAALAGATNLHNSSDTTSTGAGGPGVVTGGIAAAKANGYADTSTYCSANCPASGSVGHVTVAVNNPPANGPHAGDDHYVEAIVYDVQPTYFSKILGVYSVNVMARAVASAPPGYDLANNCLTTIQPPTASIEGVNINGNPTLNAPTCGIADNGNFNTKGNALSVNAGTFGVAGDWVNKGTKPNDITCASPTQTSCPEYPTAGYDDPLATTFNSSTAPSASGTPQTCTISGSGDANTGTSLCYYKSGTYYIEPGTYCSITIKGVATDNVVFQQGTYIIEGMNGGCSTQSLNIPGNATISGTGVFFYFTGSSTLNITGTPMINLVAPSSGTYAGLLMWQDSTDTNTNGPQLGGNDGSNYQGMLYFPNDQLTFFGNACSGCGTPGYDVGYIVAGSIALSGNPTVNLLGSTDMPAGVSTTAVPSLVE